MEWEEQVVMIAGGAGTIGSNLARTLAGTCKDLVLLDIDENGLEEIRMLLLEDGHEAKCYLCDIRNESHLIRITRETNPTVIINCSAHKHLNAGERNISECIDNNLRTTKNLLNITILTKASFFIHISTDKAVEPTSVMGASKAFCECMVRDFFKDGQYCIVRFGNVLGSQGSVWEIWRRQFAEGKPLTITDPSMKRYIISIQEACDMITRLLYHPSGTYILDMGLETTIEQLKGHFCRVKKMPSYPYKIIGVKPGEKYSEQLFWPEEHREKIPVGDSKFMWEITHSPYFEYRHIEWIAKYYDDEYTLKALQRIFPKVRA